MNGSAHRFIWETEEELGFLGAPGAVLDALSSGSASVAIRTAAALGFRDENTLTNLVFFARHPERVGRKLEKSEPGFQALSREWLEIRDRLVRPILGGAEPFQPTPAGASPEAIRRLAQVVEAAGTLPGFATFATAAAWTESRWRSSAANRTPSEASAACRLFRGARKRGFFLGNPHPEAAWCFGSGGWFGLMPATGLAAGGTKGPFSRSDPALVFHPASSVVMLADLVRRLVVSYGAGTWLAVRRGMASPGLVRDDVESKQRSRAVRARFEEALRKAGADPAFMYRKPDASGYPGAARLLEILRG
jgi:hypothetical protein